MLNPSRKIPFIAIFQKGKFEGEFVTEAVPYLET